MSYKGMTIRHKTNIDIEKGFGHRARPCPFCGCPNIAMIIGHEPYLECAECHAKGPTHKKPFDKVETPHDAEARALRRWNIRGALS